MIQLANQLYFRMCYSRILYVLVLMMSILFTHGQTLPLSKKDSGIVIHSLNNYERLLKNGDKRGASSALNDAAFTYWNNNHFESAAKNYELSLALNKEVSNENGIAMIYNNLGMLYADLGEYDKSLKSFEITLASRKANDEKIGIIAALVNISVVMNDLKEYDESVMKLMEALDLSREIYNKEQMRSVYGMLSETYEKKGEIDKSMQYFDLYRSFHEQIQREKLGKVNEQLEKEKTHSRQLGLEKIANENQILKQRLELLKAETSLEEMDSVNNDLYAHLSRTEMSIQLFEKERTISDYEAAKMQRENREVKSRNAYTLIIGSLLAFFLLIIAVLLNRNYQRSKKHQKVVIEINGVLSEKMTELDNANNLKNRLLSVISHDLKEPLHSLKTHLSIINQVGNDEELRQSLVTIQSKLSSNIDLLKNLLNWAKIELHQTKTVREEQDLSCLVDESVLILKPLANKKNIRILNMIGDNHTIRTNKDILQMVIRNVVHNGIKFTPMDGEVNINHLLVNDQNVIRITDTGIGMDEFTLNQLFDIKSENRRDGTEQEQGSGIGLFLSNELIEKIDGSISVISNPNEGTTFEIKI